MERNWSFNNTIFHYPKKKINRKEVNWAKPHSNWVKLNFDGACKGNPGQADYGAVIWDKDGRILSGTYRHIGCVTNNKEELRALEVGLLLCKQKGLSNVQIEGDSQIIINGVINSRFLNWKLTKWIPCIHTLLQGIRPYEISHIHWEGNRLADLFANLGVNLDLAEVSVDPKSISMEIMELSRKKLLERKHDGVG